MNLPERDCPDCHKPFTPKNKRQVRCRTCAYVRSANMVKRKQQEYLGREQPEEQPRGYYGENGYIMSYLRYQTDRNPESQLTPYEYGCEEYRQRLTKGG